MLNAIIVDDEAPARVREQVALHLQAHKSERIPVDKGGK